MNPIKKWQNECFAKNAVEVLNKKHYNAIYAENADAAKKLVLNMIPENSTVALGGSVTLLDMGFLDIFRTEKYKFFERYNPTPPLTILEVYRQSLLADYLVTSANAITKNGEIVCTDSSGNRVAGMIFGPNNVIIVAGVNKIVKNIDEAFKRIRKIAPLNAKRLGHIAPCVQTGECADCDCDGRICNYTGIIHNGKKIKNRITVIMVAEELGF